MKVIYNDGHVAECPEDEELHVIRHTAAHVLAQAVKRLHPEIKLAIGPAIDNGFYYDFDAPEPFTPDDLAAIEKEMEKISKENLPLERFELPRADYTEWDSGMTREAVAPPSMQIRECRLG